MGVKPIQNKSFFRLLIFLNLVQISEIYLKNWRMPSFAAAKKFKSGIPYV